MKELKFEISEHERAIVSDNGADNTIAIEIENDNQHFRQFILIDRSVANKVAEAIIQLNS